MTGTILLTGANGALGTSIITNILSRPDLISSHGIYTVRNAASATQLSTLLSKAPSEHKHQTLDLDLGSLASVRDFAANVNAQVAKGKIPPIRALILNAGYQEHTTLVSNVLFQEDKRLMSRP
jgi:NAD(P)-dependent dehydrogenase (short-subunit alcohol dehydrogenase family)